MEISFSLERLAKEIGGTVIGDGALKITGVAPLDSAKDGDLTFVTNPRYAKLAAATHAAALLCEKEIPGVPKPFLLIPNPYAALARVIELFYPRPVPAAGIQAGAWVPPTPQSFPGMRRVRSHGCVRRQGRRENRSLSGCLLRGKFRRRRGLSFLSNVTVRENCVVGNRVVLQPGAVIGSDGFGFAKAGEKYVKIPQVGNVVIEDDVELGANVCVDRAVLGTTRIGRGAKLDNLIQVGHNVVIGEHTVMAALTGISGSTQIGNHVVMGGQVGIAGHLKIGDHVTLATRTGLWKISRKKGSTSGRPRLSSPPK